MPDIAWNAGLHAGWMRGTRTFRHAAWELLGNQRENIWAGLGHDPRGMIRHAIRGIWLYHGGHRLNLLDERLSQMGVGIDVVEEGMQGYLVSLVYRARG